MLKQLYHRALGFYYKKVGERSQKELYEAASNLPENEYEDYLRDLYKTKTNNELDFANPVTYTQKLQWLKLYGYSKEQSVFVDKYSIKEYIIKTLGEQYVIPLLSVNGKDHFYDANEIDFSELPKSFVIKCNHGSAYNFIIKDKTLLSNKDIKKIKRRLNLWLKEKFAFKNGLELLYNNVKPCIIIEKYMSMPGYNELIDYKYFCFDGEPKIMYVSNDIGEDPRTDFFDMDFKHLDIRARDKNADVMPQKPKEFEEMKRISKLLAKDLPHVRIDFYCIDSQIYVGEMTFFHSSGYSLFKPDEYEKVLGSWITIDQSKRENNLKYRKK